jgi:Tfp pilus assembly protein PilO
MNSKLTTVTLGVLLIVSLAYAVYSNSQLSGKQEELEKCRHQYESDISEWKDRYEEALVDVTEAFKRLEEKDEQLKHVLDELQKQKGRK